MAERSDACGGRIFPTAGHVAETWAPKRGRPRPGTDSARPGAVRAAARGRVGDRPDGSRSVQLAKTWTSESCAAGQPVFAVKFNRT